MSFKCSYKDLILKHHDKAFLCTTAAQKICADKQEIINFFQIYWCIFEGNTFLLIVLAALVIFLAFKYTSIAVDEYLAEGITKLSDWLKFSEALSAVTLLAFANGAGDLITALVASGSEGGISYNIGALFGAGMFVASAVVATCILQSETDIVFDKMIIFRDIGIYLLATILTIVFAFVGKITWWMSLILLSLYVVLVLVVVIEDKIKAGSKGTPVIDGKNEDPEVSESLVQGGRDEEDEGLTQEEKERKSERSRAIRQRMIKIVTSERFINYKEQLVKEGKIDLGNKKDFRRKETMAGRGSNRKGGDSRSLGMFMSVVREVKLGLYIRKKLEMKKEFRQRPDEDKSIVDEIIEFVEWPYFMLLYLTNLPCQEEQYSRLRCMVWCYPGTFFLWYVFHPVIDITYIYYALPAASAIFVIFAFTLQWDRDDEPPSWFILISLMGVVSSLAWTYLIIGALIDLLGVIGVIFNIDETYLGLTILAIGNALPDALTTISLCKQGAGVMAISGGYAGQLFGYLVGFGASMLKLTLKKGPQKFDLFDMGRLKENLLDLLVIFVAFIILGYTFTTGVLSNFRMNKVFATNLMIIYGIFVLFATAIAVKNAIGF